MKIKIRKMKTILTMILGLTLIFGVTSCHKEKFGCTDPQSLNYDADATTDDGSCQYIQEDYLLTGTLNSDKTLDPTVIWSMQGSVIVPNGVTLTIIPHLA